MEWKGLNCSVSSPETKVVANAEEWKRLWSEALGRTEPPPPVDFSRRLAIVVFLGSRPTGGYGVDFIEPKRIGGKFVVGYRVRAPGKGMFVIQAFTRPYAVRLFERPSLPLELRELKPPAPGQ